MCIKQLNFSKSQRVRFTRFTSYLFTFQSKTQAIGLLYSLEDVGSTLLSQTLVGEEPIELSSQAVSLLVSREEPDFLAGSVLSSKGYSFMLPSDPYLFGNGTQFVDSQV